MRIPRFATIKRGARASTALLAVLMLLVSASIVNASTFVSVNFVDNDGGDVDSDVNRDNTHGVFADDDAVYVWNEIGQASGALSSLLQDTDGGTSGIKVTTTYQDDATGWAPANGVLDRGVFGSNANTVVMTISGLTIGGMYELAVFDSTTHPIEVQTVEGNAPTAFTNELAGATDYVDGLTTAGTYTYWLATADSSGELEWLGSGSINFNTLTGFQIREVVVPTVPEPSTFVLAAFGLVGLVARRRRRRR